jgi:PAS domain S-box-containing protein
MNVTIHQDNRVVLVNSECVRMFHANNANDLIGADITQQATEAGKKQIAEHIRARKDRVTDVPDHYFITLRRMDGEEFPAEVFASDIVYQGRPASQAVVFDITERVRAEEMLRLRV